MFNFPPKLNREKHDGQKTQWPENKMGSPFGKPIRFR
jgi:hypothetical protein